MFEFLKRLFVKNAEPVPAEVRFVSEALQVEEGYFDTALQEAVKAIDTVHKDGKLPSISVTRALLTNRHGQFLVRATGEILIQISYFTQHPELTTVHETGHFLDYSGLDKPGEFASLTSPRLAAWRQVVQESQAVQRLKPLFQSGETKATETLSDGTVVEYDIDQAYLRYLLGPQELWARSYAQYIAIKSGNSDLLLQVDHLRDKPAHAFYYGEHWEDADFETILAEIKNLFYELGWV